MQCTYFINSFEQSTRTVLQLAVGLGVCYLNFSQKKKISMLRNVIQDLKSALGNNVTYFGVPEKAGYLTSNREPWSRRNFIYSSGCNLCLSNKVYKISIMYGSMYRSDAYYVLQNYMFEPH
jgi:hypothetical protein